MAQIMTVKPNNIGVSSSPSSSPFKLAGQQIQKLAGSVCSQGLI